VIPAGIEWTSDRDEVLTLFAHDIRRRIRFLSFLRNGFSGVFLFEGSRWIDYCWTSKPSVLGPPHLPRSIQQKQVYWFFYAHTREEFRGRGFQKITLSMLANQVLRENQNARIYADISPENIASRRAFMSVGFVPNGVIERHCVGLPRIWTRTWGSWDPNASHPRL